jgi:peptidoglycan/LPS O-acetylase OafA/YrhL
MFWGWSLCVEEHFYLAVPLLMAGLGRLTSHRARLLSLVGLWLMGPVVRGLVYLRHAGEAGVDWFQVLYIPTHTRFDILIAGVLLAYVLHTERPRLEAWFARPWVRRASAALSVAAFGLLLAVGGSGAGAVWWGVFSIGTVTGVAYFNLILWLLLAPGRLARALGARPFLKMATLGYGVYLVHMPWVVFLGVFAYALLWAGLHAPPLAAFAGAVAWVFAVSLAEAYVLHVLIEKPALAIRDWLTPERRGRRAALRGRRGDRRGGGSARRTSGRPRGRSDRARAG